MDFFRQRSLLDMTRAESFIFLGVLRRIARERVTRVFVATWTRRIMLPRPISRVMQLGASVKILSTQLSKIKSLKGVMDRYSQRSLAKVNSPLKYLTVLILLKKLGEFFFLLFLQSLTMKLKSSYCEMVCQKQPPT